MPPPADSVFVDAVATSENDASVRRLLSGFLTHVGRGAEESADLRSMAMACVAAAETCTPLHDPLANELSSAVAGASCPAAVVEWLLAFMEPKCRGGRAVNSNEDAAFVAFAVDGALPREAVVPALHRCGANPTHAQINDLLKNEGDTIGVVAFRNVANACHQTATTRDELMAAFRALDLDGNGVLDASEFAVLLQGDGEPLSDEEVQAALALADTNGDGRISVDEFVALMCDDAAPITAPKPRPADAIPAQTVSPSLTKRDFLNTQMEDARMRSEELYRRRQGMSSERRERERRLAEEAEQERRREEEAAARRAIDEKAARNKKSSCCVVA
uniref:EF-hand domain-containing protein n=1 Tax=Neobodo designis TaxID=312471 RepID=A0A7S1KZP8_NEODS|mmetsp:Transcript_11993/g.37341  ORF Transcript_11993/g.37341 Transcript_11993/m.37341 type:complete len:332 (+) Transcript_11993:944-1939(+)